MRQNPGLLAVMTGVRAARLIARQRTDTTPSRSASDGLMLAAAALTTLMIGWPDEFLVPRFPWVI